MGKIIDLTGKHFGRLTVKSPSRVKGRHYCWLCLCECGKLTEVRSQDIRNGHTQSCGCIHKEWWAAQNITHGKTGTLEFKLWKGARERALKNNLPFNITVHDIFIPEYCPLLGIPLIVGVKHCHKNSPSLDRIIPELGYVKGNIQVISMRANNIKTNATLDEIRLLIKNWENRL